MRCGHMIWLGWIPVMINWEISSIWTDGFPAPNSLALLNRGQSYLLQNTHNRHPIAHLLLAGLLCLFTSSQPSISGILPKGSYLPCLHLADRALLAGYPWHILYLHHCIIVCSFLLWKKQKLIILAEYSGCVQSICCSMSPSWVSLWVC